MAYNEEGDLEPALSEEELTEREISLAPEVLVEVKRLVAEGGGDQYADISDAAQSRMLEVSAVVARLLEDTIIPNGWIVHRVIANAVLFINEACLDFSVCLRAMLLEQDAWREKYHARNTALLVFEMFEDVPVVLGKEFREAVKRLQIPPEMLKELERHKKRFTKFGERHAPVMKQIRLVAAAHRDHDALKLKRTTDALPMERFYPRCWAFGHLLKELGPPLQAIYVYACSVDPRSLR